MFVNTFKQSVVRSVYSFTCFSSVSHVSAAALWEVSVGSPAPWTPPLSDAGASGSSTSSQACPSHLSRGCKTTFRKYKTHVLRSIYTYVLIKSMAWALSWSALCRSASMRISAALSIDKFVQRASSHITFSLSSAY